MSVEEKINLVLNGVFGISMKAYVISEYAIRICDDKGRLIAETSSVLEVKSHWKYLVTKVIHIIIDQKIEKTLHEI